MINKVYEKVKNYIKENYKTLILFIVLVLLVTIRLPYYISAPGGLINTADKVSVDSDFELSGSLNMAYVTGIDGTIPMLLYALINPNWDISKEEDVTVGSESIEDEEYRNKMLLEQANDIAQMVAYKYSDIDYEITNNKVYVTYVDDLAETDLEVGDQIIEFDGKKVTEKQDLYDYVDGMSAGDEVTFTVIRGSEEIKCISTLIDVSGQPKIGLVITETFDITSSVDVEFDFNNNESGSSGGLMMALTIYSYINEVDLTGGRVIVGTGTIESDGSVGMISGIKYKLLGAVKNDADIFLVPEGNYEEALELKEENDYDIELVMVKTFDEALEYLLK